MQREAGEVVDSLTNSDQCRFLEDVCDHSRPGPCVNSRTAPQNISAAKSNFVAGSYFRFGESDQTG